MHCQRKEPVRRNSLFFLPYFRFNSILITLHSLDSDDLLLFGEEIGRCRIIGEAPGEEDEGHETEEGDDDHEPLPLVGVAVRVRVVDAEGEEGGDDEGEAVQVEGPTYLQDRDECLNYEANEETLAYQPMRSPISVRV